MFMAKIPQLVICQVTLKMGDAGYRVPCLIPQELCTAPLGVGGPGTFFHSMFIGRILVVSPFVGDLLRPPFHCDCRTEGCFSLYYEGGLSPPTLSKGPGALRATLHLGGCTRSHRQLQASPGLEPASGQVSRPGRPDWGLARSLGQSRLRTPRGKERDWEGPGQGNRVSPRRALRPARGTPEVPNPPTAASSDPAAAAGRGGRCGAGRPRAPPLAPARPPRAAPPPPAEEGSAARAHWRARGPDRGLSLEGGRWEVGRRRAAHPPGPPPAPPSTRGRGGPPCPSNEWLR